MEFGSIERELHIQASPEVVYEVISSPDHLREWWPDDVDLDPVVGGGGSLTFNVPDVPGGVTVPVAVVEADPPRRFAFRWAHDEGQAATETNSLLVTFDLEPTEDGTLVRFTETGFREMGWEAAVLEATYLDHVEGWGTFLPRLVDYAPTLVADR